MVVGFLIIFFFPFIFLFTQLNNLNTKTEAIKKAMIKRKETYFDPIECCERWTITGEKVTRCKWIYSSNEAKDVIEGDDVLMGVKTNTIYYNYSKELFKQHIQKQKNTGKIWCYERHAYNEQKKNDYKLKYHMEDHYFFYVGFDPINHYYYIHYYNTTRKDKISYETYKKLGGYDFSDQTRRYK